MINNNEQKAFVDVNFDITQKERIQSFLQQFAPDFTGYILDQSPEQLYSKEYTIRIYYQQYSTFTLACDSHDMLQTRIENIFNINKQVRFINRHPAIEKQTISYSRKGKEESSEYYSATLEVDFTKTS